MSIKDFEEKGNTDTIYYSEIGEGVPFYKKIYLALIIILISTLSFGLGRLSGEGSKPGVTIEYEEIESAPLVQSTQASVLQAVESVSASPTTSGEVVGSKNGTKYHFVHCPGAKQIKEANKVVFPSPAAAESAGYTLAGNCSPK